MPIYDYKCERCSACFEVKQSFDDKPSVVCHICGGEAKRIFKPVPIVFKGPGFYVTDTAAEREKKFKDRKDGHKTSSTAIPKASDSTTKKAEGPAA